MLHGERSVKSGGCVSLQSLVSFFFVISSADDMRGKFFSDCCDIGKVVGVEDDQRNPGFLQCDTFFLVGFSLFGSVVRRAVQLDCNNNACVVFPAKQEVHAFSSDLSQLLKRSPSITDVENLGHAHLTENMQGGSGFYQFFKQGLFALVQQLELIHVFRPRSGFGRRGFSLHGFRSFSLSDGFSHLGGSFFSLLVHPVGKGKDGGYANRPAYEGF